MRINNWSMAMCMLFFSAGSFAQEKKQLSLEEVMQLAYHNSNDAKVLDSKVKTRQLEYEASKDSQLPEAKLSGTYLMMNSPTVDLKIPVGGGSEAPDIATNRLFLGQLAVNMPLYTGGKIKKQHQIGRRQLEIKRAASHCRKTKSRHTGNAPLHRPLQSATNDPPHCGEHQKNQNNRYSTSKPWKPMV